MTNGCTGEERENSFASFRQGAGEGVVGDDQLVGGFAVLVADGVADRHLNAGQAVVELADVGVVVDGQEEFSLYLL